MSLFQYGALKLSSGRLSKFKIDCDALTVGDLRCLAYLAYQILPRFGGVVGVPRGGLLLAEALREYASPPGPWLVVDDVLTTGASMERMRSGLNEANGQTLGLVLFARGPCPGWVRVLFPLPEELWSV